MSPEKRGPSAGRFKREIKKLEQQLDNAYQALGVRAHKLIKEGKIKHQELKEVSAEVDSLSDTLETERAQLEKLIAQKKGMKCPYCGAKSAPGARFCPGCGKELPIPQGEPTICPGCGKALQPQAAFCVHCGNKIES